MQIRKAKIEDVPRIAEMAVDFNWYLDRIDQYYPLSKDLKRLFLDYFRKNTYSSRSLLLVATEGEKIFGFALAKIRKTPLIWGKRPYGDISFIYLEKEYQRIGMADRFLSHIYKWYKEKKIKEVELTVLEKNKQARAAWKKYGFREYILRLRKKI
ncbi:MAG: GNAT family N-acetyltransferase [Candidatus Moranbacteria bacterium]|nr:GNAT family N-acetyltransferase [Candidatus Moranbacteria bacterium]